jgi:uncharacterized protein YceH (UPF0502 family)
MSNIVLTPEEARILGSLMEKSVVTPEQYPLTLNALTLACNQKSSRDPVMSLDQGAVQHTARQLENKHLVSSEENFRGRVVKYTQRLCNTPFGEFQLSEDEFAVICLLLLRGRQTPGELRARSGRLHEFESNEAVDVTLNGLMNREEGALVARLPRSPGRRDFEYMHLFYGPIESVTAEVVTRASGTADVARPPDRISRLESRIDQLEQELQELKKILGPSSEASS